MSFWDILKSILPLVALIAILFGVLVWVRKYSFSVTGKKLQNLHVDVIHNQIILPKKYLSLVRVQDKVLVLGISENNITLLKEVEYNSNLDLQQESGELKNNFIDILKQNLGMK